MPFRRPYALSALCLAVLVGISPAVAQNEQADKAKQQAAEQAKKEAQRLNDLAEVSKQLTGPAGNPECVWVGRRVVHRLFQDDLDTAFRHMDLYDRFGCPGGHIQAAFRCVVKQGPVVDAKAENILSRVHSCWVNPASPPPPAAAATTPQAGTTTQ
ncbi:beta-1-3, beta-1-6-glucan biosynthesis protein [Pseudorhodoplanes sp.]|uniref:beta-1-3, beta-1-6-glucan biosynthesis protein n=1 Tax=Pseudorhodoplanes sp. TaxID=1934341 RepID=UPI002D80CFA1|nr:beta-1-3, beta-1-6-glucan biosynthesis protein [Pseudorhodoplanes sp.]